MKNLSHFDEKSQSFLPSQVGRYGKALQKNLSLLILHTLYKRIGYVIISRPHFSSREGINCRRLTC